jgi:hypothetical protein
LRFQGFSASAIRSKVQIWKRGVVGGSIFIEELAWTSRKVVGGSLFIEELDLIYVIKIK